MIITITIFLLCIALLIHANYKNKSQSLLESSLKLSIIIAAKNEGHNISSLITSLSKQDFPKENYEIIIVDDNSIDNTFNKAKAETLNYNNISILKANNKKYIGKRGALQFGIENAKHQNILITDADCKPNKNWIKVFANKFTEGYDFIFGIAPYKQTESFINKIACFENLRTHILTFGFANLELPYSAAARSFGFKKESFLKIKGYENTTDTLSGDDDLLLREAVKNKMKIATVSKPEAFVFSETKKTFTEYIKQKSRHTSTSNYYSFTTKLLLALWHTLNLLFLFSPLLMFINLNFGIFFLVKIITDFITVKLLQKRFGYHFNLLEIIILQIIYEVMLVVNYFNGTFHKNEW